MSRVPVTGTHGMVTSGHYLATAAGVEVLRRGGNAADAAAAVGFCLAVLEPHKNGLGGEVPVLVYSARDRRVYAVSGLGWAPEALTIDWCRGQGVDLIPGDGLVPATVPAVVGTWLLVLDRFGTMSLGEVLAPAIAIARRGFAVYPALWADLKTNFERYTELYPSTGAVYLPGGRLPELGDLLPNPDAAATLEALVRAESGARLGGGPSASRRAGLEAARRLFYEGEIAQRILDFADRHAVVDATGAQHRGLFSAADLAEWRATVEEPVTYRYRGLDVHKCSTWTQGPVFLQQLSLLAGYDLAALPPAEGLHVVWECAKLAFADREAYYGDPLFDAVPLGRLLSDDYAAARRRLVGDRASLELRPGLGGSWGVAGGPPGTPGDHGGAGAPHTADTTHLDVMDAAGNLVAATPSGGWIASSPVIPGLGFALGTRAQMFYLDPGRPNALAPRKRPRATLSPTLVTREGQPYLAFGTPGGDSQDQWNLQFFLGHVDFGLGLQEALDTPHWHLVHFPSSFYPREARPGVVLTDGRLPPEVAGELAERGHHLETGDYPPVRLMAIRYDQTRGTMTGSVASTSGVAYAFGW